MKEQSQNFTAEDVQINANFDPVTIEKITTDIFDQDIRNFITSVGAQRIPWRR